MLKNTEVDVASGWICPKCGNTSYETDQFAATGGGFSKVFDIQNKKFSTVSCLRCKYTEFYKAQTSALGNLFDFFTN
jgi:predicted nucleic-acid-binding Zn-ribbon protein